MSKKIKKILEKKNKRKIVSLTAYSKNIAQVLDKYCDIILVGDSMANVLYAMNNTHKISLNTTFIVVPAFGDKEVMNSVSYVIFALGSLVSYVTCFTVS